MSWADGFTEYTQQAYEVRLHKRRNTFGGMIWPERPRTPLDIAIDALDKLERTVQ